MEKRIIFSEFLIRFIAIIILFTHIFSCNQREKIALLEEKIELFKTTNTPIRFKITEKKNGKIKVAIKFYDTEGTDFRRTEMTLKGNELSFDFLVFSVKDKHLAFPYKVYTDEIAPDKGEDLTEFYDKKDFPQIFYFKGIDEELQEGMSSVFEKIKTNDISSDDKYFGNMVHDISELKSYRVDRIYKIITHIKGGIEVVEE